MAEYTCDILVVHTQKESQKNYIINDNDSSIIHSINEPSSEYMM